VKKRIIKRTVNRDGKSGINASTRHVPPHFLQVDLQQLCIVATNSNTIIKTKSSKKLEVMGFTTLFECHMSTVLLSLLEREDNPLSPH
jgi:hypothetical protein